MTDYKKRIENRILTFMSDNLHIILEDEGDQSEIPRTKFAKDLAAQLANTIAQEANKAAIAELEEVKKYFPEYATSATAQLLLCVNNRIVILESQLTADKEQADG